MLVEETLRTCAQYLTAALRKESEEHRNKTYHSLVLRGKLRMEERWITKQETGGVLYPEEYCTKTGDVVMEVLRTKHPNTLPLSSVSLDTYTGRSLELIPVNITEEMVTEIEERLSGGAIPGGVDLVDIQNYLLIFGTASREFCLTGVKFAEWIANWLPLWAAYRALVSGRLIALDKKRGVRPVGVGETWHRLMAQ